MTQVLKRDATQEDWDRSKLLASLANAGVSAEEAEKVTAEVEAWVTTEGANGPVPSTAIRSKVTEVLQPGNADAATAYSGWVKPE